MAVTRIQDVIQPEQFTQYAIQRTMEKSALVQSGIVENNAEFDALASGPHTLINMPYWGDLTGDAEVMDDTGDTTPQNIAASKDVARKLGLVKSWGVNALAAYLSGDDPMGAIAELVSDYWVREYQKTLLSALDGAFEGDGMAGKVHDISAETGDAAVFTANTFIDANQLMGDAKDLLTGVAMHSAVEAHLAKQDLIEYIRDSEGRIIMRSYMGKTVIVDDGMPFDSTTGVGAAYLFGAGAVALGNGSHPDIEQTELVRKGLSLAGEDILVTRRLPLLHPRGVKWTEAEVAGTFPTLAELEDGDNWKREYEEKAIRIVKFVFKIG